MTDIPKDHFLNPKEGHENHSNHEPERPLECSECKRPIDVHYTEIVGNNITHVYMCNECPELERRLRGVPSNNQSEGVGTAGLACGECGTTLQAVRVGNPLGCSNCYEVFEDIIVSELIITEKIPSRIINNKKNIPLHFGRSPGEIQEINPTLRLLALNEELTETLKREDYEQAAWLRDQIRALTEEREGKGNDQKS